MVIALCFILYALILGLSIDDNSIYYALAASTVMLIVLQPVLQRMARSIWIAFFVRYDPNWQKHLPQQS